MATATAEVHDTAGAQELAPGEWRLEPEPVDTTLGEHGPHLVIGGGPFRFRPKDIGLRVEVGREVEASPYYSSRPGGLVMLAKVGLHLAELGDEKLNGKEVAERIVALGSASYFDLLYLAHYRRAEEDCGIIDHPGGWKCPKCKQPIGRTDLDLRKLRVRVHKTEPRVVYRFRKPWRWKGQDVTTATLGPPSLARAFETMSAAELTIDDLFQQRLLAAAIRQFDDMAVGVLRPQDLERPDEKLGRGIHSDDFDGLCAALEQMAGPHAFIEWRHGNDDDPNSCGGTLPIPLGWQASFF